MIILYSSVISFLFCVLIIYSSFFNREIFNDFQTEKIQKIHDIPVPRIGGLAIYLTISILSVIYSLPLEHTIILTFIFSIGFFEDIFKDINILFRFGLISAITLVGVLVLDVRIDNVGIFFIDNILSYEVVSILITIFAIVGVINSFNIIDGLNGLCSGISIIVFACFLFFSYLVNDHELTTTFNIIIGACIGFFLINITTGKIFLGDGGAYILGFLASFFGLYITVKYSIISKWAILLICLYPILETLYTIYRRLLIRKRNPSKPDSLHMHHLLLRRVTNIAFMNVPKLFKNSITSTYIITLSIINGLLACCFFDKKNILISLIFINILIYILFYSLIVRFKTKLRKL